MNEPFASQPVSWRPRLLRLRRRARRALPFAAGMLATLVALALYNLLLPAPRPLTISEMNEVVAQALASATPPPTFSARVYRVIQPSLVLIETQGSGLDDGEGRLGSGVVIDDLGDILTSLHVVAKASAIRITFADGTQSGAQVIVEQPENDIAVLRANRLPALLVPAILGNPDASRVGDEAFVVGNPFGLYSSMSAGVISGFGRSFEQPDNGQILQGLIQVDAAVNPGNSGGPLLNRDGHVIGIITGIVNPTEQDVFIGIGFAVPIGEAAAAAGSPPH